MSNRKYDDETIIKTIREALVLGARKSAKNNGVTHPQVYYWLKKVGLKPRVTINNIDWEKIKEEVQKPIE